MNTQDKFQVSEGFWSVEWGEEYGNFFAQEFNS